MRESFHWVARMSSGNGSSSAMRLPGVTSLPDRLTSIWSLCDRTRCSHLCRDRFHLKIIGEHSICLQKRLLQKMLSWRALMRLMMQQTATWKGCVVMVQALGCPIMMGGWCACLKPSISSRLKLTTLGFTKYRFSINSVTRSSVVLHRLKQLIPCWALIPTVT